MDLRTLPIMKHRCSLVVATTALTLALAGNAHASGSFGNPTPLTIPDSGPASLYPSVVNVAGQDAFVTDVDVVLNGLSHTHPDDLEIVLVSPTGAAVRLISDACGAVPVSSATWRFDDEAPVGFPDNPAVACGSGSYRPTNGTGTSALPAPAPPSVAGSALSRFDYLPPNGEWKLFVADDEADDVGQIASGWSLELTARPARNVGFAVPAVTVVEGTPLDATIVRDPGPGRDAEVRWRLTSGSAVFGQDVLGAPTGWSMAGDEVVKSVQFPVPANVTREGPETFQITLERATGDAAIDPARSVLAVTIAADPLLPFRTLPIVFRTARGGRGLGRVVSVVVNPGLPSATSLRVRCVRACGPLTSLGSRTITRFRTKIPLNRRIVALPRTIISVTVTAAGYTPLTRQFRFRVRGRALVAQAL